jgi:Trypsin-like peptidase domain
MVMFVVCAIAATAVALILRDAPRARPANIGGIPTATRSAGAPEIGALYATSSAKQHGCTAGVVHSRGGNTLITAAHCVVGSGAGMVFVPGQHGARTPYGRWTVTAAYLEPDWVARQDPRTDVAFLTVAPQTINGLRTEIEQVTGAYRLGSTAVRGQRVTITGYPGGGPNDPIMCVTKVYFTKGFPSFDCHGFVGGTSGSPWLAATRHGTRIVGVIGGFHQGGCLEYTSYSSPLAPDADAAYHGASDAAPPGVAPRPGSDGC